jgi:hypothetical protein
MKKYIRSSDENTNREYYAFTVKGLKDNIETYLDLKDDSYLDSWWVQEPVWYAYIANSGMTDIDVAFISKDRSKVENLNMNSPEVQSVLGGDEYRDEYGITFDSAIEELYQKGIIVIDDESGKLDHIGDALLLGSPLGFLVDQVIEFEGTDDLDEIYDSIIHDYGDKVVDDLYTDTHYKMIVPVKKEHWRF